MRTLRLVPCLLALACSEYGFNGQRDPAPDGADPSDPPSGPSGPEDDTAEPPEDGEPDCDRDLSATFQQLPLPQDMEGAHLPTDFDADGYMLAVSPFAYPGDLLGIAHNGLGKPLFQDLPKQPFEARMLSDGRMIWITEQAGQYGLTVFDPQQGVEVADFEMAPIRQMEPTHEGTVYLAIRSGGDNGTAIVHFDPASGDLDPVTGPLPHFGIVRDIAVSKSGSRVYYTARHVDGANIYEALYGVPRMGPSQWGEPVRLWTSPTVPLIGVKLAVDKCDNLYVAQDQDLWVIPPDGGMSEHAGSLEVPVYIDALIWGSGAGDAKDDALYAVGFDPDTSTPIRFEIELGVDGTHVLAR